MAEEDQESLRYSFRGKVMISSAIILFLACFVIVIFHVYSRWCRRPVRRLNSEFLSVMAAPIASDAATPQGLDLRDINSLPTFVYESEKQESPPGCAVCLSEFQDGETGRTLPECNHCFHVGCIDTWFQSHRDCPLCRARVKGRPVGNSGSPDFTVVSIYVLEGAVSGSGSDLIPTGQSDGIRISNSSPSSSSSEAAEAETPKLSTKSEGSPDPDGSSGRALDPEPGFRVSRLWL